VHEHRFVRTLISVKALGGRPNSGRIKAITKLSTPIGSLNSRNPGVE
jgi:hypothetical protein